MSEFLSEFIKPEAAAQKKAEEEKANKAEEVLQDAFFQKFDPESGAVKETSVSATQKAATPQAADLSAVKKTVVKPATQAAQPQTAKPAIQGTQPAKSAAPAVAVTPGGEQVTFYSVQPGTEPTINKLLKMMVEMKGSDLHLTLGSKPMTRVNGGLVPLNVKELSADMNKKIICEILTRDEQKRLLIDKEEIDACYHIEGVGRFRMSVFHQLYGIVAVYRTIPIRILSIQELGFSEEVAKSICKPKGFCAVTGPTGSGKSTTLAALIDYINANRDDHIITIEDPIEFVHQNKRSIITHRAVGEHTPNFKSALKAALRQDPDVILLGEMRDMETIEIALTAAETGHMVFGTLHTNSAAETISRIINVFPADKQSQIALQLATVITAVIAQDLVVRKDGKGRVAAWEILIATGSARNLIKEGKIPQVYSVIETGKKYGMQTMKMAYDKLLQDGLIAEEIYQAKLAGMKDA